MLHVLLHQKDPCKALSLKPFRNSAQDGELMQRRKYLPCPYRLHSHRCSKICCTRLLLESRLVMRIAAGLTSSITRVTSLSPLLPTASLEQQQPPPEHFAVSYKAPEATISTCKVCKSVWQQRPFRAGPCTVLRHYSQGYRIRHIGMGRGRGSVMRCA